MIGQATLDQSSAIPSYPNVSWLHYERPMRLVDGNERLFYDRINA